MDYSQTQPTEQDTSTQTSAASNRKGELELAVITAVNDNGLVTIQSNETSQTESAIATVSINDTDIGRQVALMRTKQPQPQVVIIGLIRSSVDRLFDIIDVTQSEGTQEQTVDYSPSTSDKTVNIDGEKVVITGENEMVLQCGDASITLRKDGKIVIRGKSLLNRASGVNRIMGGSVQVN